MTRAPFGDPNGDQLVDGINTRFKSLFDAAAFPLTDVGGTANDVTATVVPALDGDGLLDGMSFTITWADENTGPMTLALNGGPPVPVLGVDGSTLAPGSVGAGLRSLVTYIGGDFVLLSPTLLMGGGGGAARFYWAFESSGTWEKPEGLSANTPVRIQGWGGGGGSSGGTGSTGFGGGGAGYNEIILRAGDLPETVTVIVADGGAVNADGGDSSFGSFLTAYGGQRANSNNSAPGAGGGTLQRGIRHDSPYLHGGYSGGGIPASDQQSNWAIGIWGGGGGAARTASGARRGGNATYGGGGGASGGSGTAAGGVSTYGGDGGAQGQAGVAPGGGGGAGAAGARGEIRIWI